MEDSQENKSEIKQPTHEEKSIRPRLVEEQENIWSFMVHYNQWFVIVNNPSYTFNKKAEMESYWNFCLSAGIVVDYMLTSKKISKDEKSKLMRYIDILNDLAEKDIKKKKDYVKEIYHKILEKVNLLGLFGLQEYGTYIDLLEKYKEVLLSRVKNVNTKSENDSKRELILIINFKRKPENIQKTTETIGRVLNKISDFISDWGTLPVIPVLFYVIMADSLISNFDTNENIKKRINTCDELIKELKNTSNADQVILGGMIIFYSFIARAYVNLTSAYSVNIQSS